MNKLLIPNGGMPLFGDDFGFLDAANRDAFKGVIYEIAKQYDGNLVLGGCEFSQTATHFNVTEGYVMLNYEICYCPAQSVLKDGNTVAEIVPDNFYDPDGLKTFANATSQNTWQVRRAKLTAGTSDGYIQEPGAPVFSDGIYGLLAEKITTSSGIVFYNSWQAEVDNEPYVHKTFRMVQFAGGMIPGTINGSGFTKIALLPSGYRPINQFKFIAAAFGVGVYGNVMLEIFTNGEVYAISTDGNTYDLVSINQTFLSA